jgi:hypothetical protein
VNFIGHATVALSRGDHPSFVLGSMLPDFAGMARTRLARARSGPLAEGIALHHRTDDVFHGTAAFTSLLQRALDELCAAGVARGTARAVAHIGTEMLIDGELVREPAVAAAYLEALRAGEQLSDVFVDAEGALRFEQLRARLLSFGAPYDYREPEAVLWRLERVLAARPRLAIEPAARSPIMALLPGLQTRVVEVLPALVQSVCEAVR